MAENRFEQFLPEDDARRSTPAAASTATPGAQPGNRFSQFLPSDDPRAAPVTAPKDAGLWGEIIPGLRSGIPNLGGFVGDIGQIGTEAMGAAGEEWLSDLMAGRIGEALFGGETQHPRQQSEMVVGPAIKSLLTQGLSAVGVQQPGYEPASPEGRIGRMIGEGIVTSFIPGLSGLGAANKARGLMGVAAEVPRVAVAGAGAGAASQAVMEYAPVPDQWKMPLALATGLAGGVGGYLTIPAAIGTARAGLSGLGGVRDYLRAANPSARNMDILASKELARTPTDRTQAEAALASPPEAPPGVRLTSYQVTGDQGIGSREMAMARAPDPAFKAALSGRMDEQNTARVDALKGIAQAGDPQVLGARITQWFRDLEARVADLTGKARVAAQERSEALGDMPAGETGARARDAVLGEHDRLKDEYGAMYEAVDPTGKMHVETAPITATAKRIYGEMSPEEMLSLSTQEKQLAAIIRGYGETLPFKRFRELRSQISEAMRDAKSPLSPNNKAYGRLSQLYEGLDEAMSASIAARSAADDAAVKAGTMPEEATLAAKFVERARERYERPTGPAPVAGAEAGAPGQAAGVPGRDGTPGAEGGASGRTASGQGLPANAGRTHNLGGLEVSIQHPAGTLRAGVSRGNEPWVARMHDHYGEIAGTQGPDGQPIDVFVAPKRGPVTDDAPVFVIDQVDPKTGVFDETKVMLGYSTADEALAAYNANYAPGWKGAGKVTPTTVGGLKEWIAKGDTKGAFGAPEPKAAEMFQAAPPVESEAFKRWFGASKVVDADGKPLTVYKAMNPYDDAGNLVDTIDRPSEFPAFDGPKERGIKIAGFFGDSKVASRFAEIFGNEHGIFPSYLSLKNPFVIDATGMKAGQVQFGKSGAPFREAMRGGEYDGAIIKNTSDEGDIYVALKPTQIKSVFNRGTFNPNDPRILYQDTQVPARWDTLDRDARATVMSAAGVKRVPGLGPGAKWDEFPKEARQKLGDAMERLYRPRSAENEFDQAQPSAGLAKTFASRASAAGLSPQEAAASGALVDSFYATAAKRLGTTVEELAAKYPLPRVEKGGEGGALAQSQTAAPPFYSAALRVVEGMEMKKANADKWMAELRKGANVKKEELEWLGIEPWLRSQGGMVTREQIEDFIRANQISVADDLAPKALFSNYTEPGGKNYKELRLILKGTKKPPFVRSHWGGDENVLMHVRFNDRNINGKKTVFIEELQSDWHQKGRRYGYVTADEVERSKARTDIDALYKEREQVRKGLDVQVLSPAERVDVLAEVQRLIDADEFTPEAMSQYERGLTDTTNYEDFAHQLASVGGRDEVVKPLWDAAEGRNFPQLRDIDARIEQLQGIIKAGNSIPDAPFKTSWPELAFKRMVRWAAENGYDQIAWTPGSIQSKRFDPKLSPFYDETLVNIANKLGKAFGANVERADVKFGGGLLYRLFRSADEADNPRRLKEGEVVKGVPVLSITPEMRAASLAGQPLFQGGRGSIAFGEPENIIRLFKSADASTLPHELGHHFLDMYRQFASGTDAPAALAKDWAAAKAWWSKNAAAVAKDGKVEGVTADDVRKVLNDQSTGDEAKDVAVLHGMHEQWARAFETYLRTGEAPNQALKGIFAQFKEWLSSVYKTLAGLDVEMSPQIKAVFDRMLKEPGSGARPDMLDAPAVQRYGAANTAFREHKDIYSAKGASPVPEMLRRPGSTYPFDMPDEKVAASLFKPGPEGASAINAVLRGAGDAPEARTAIEAAAVSSLRRSAEKDGIVDPAKFGAWRAKHADALRLLPEIDVQMGSAADAGRALENIVTRGKEVVADVQKSAIGKLIGAEDVVARLTTMLGKDDAAKAMRELATQAAKDPDALEGLRRGTVEAITRQATLSKGALSADKFVKFVEKNSRALAQVLTPEQMQSVYAIRDDLRRAARSPLAPGGGSQTAELTAAQRRFNRDSPTLLGAILHNVAASSAAGALTHVVFGSLPHSIATGISSSVLGGAMQALRANGLRRVDQLIQQAMLEPEVMRRLLAMAPKTKDAASVRALREVLWRQAEKTGAITAGLAALRADEPKAEAA